MGDWPSSKNLKPKSERVLRILLGGAQMEDRGNAYVIQDGVLCFVMLCEGERYFIGCDMSLTQFLAWSEKFDDDYLFLKGGEIALREMNAERSERRSRLNKF